MNINFNNKNSQISIFILISIIIIFLLVFLIFSNNDTKKNEIENSQIINNLNKNSKILSLKNTVDNCLTIELKKATIISGYRGGFIYDTSNQYNHEYYVSGINLPRSLDYNFNILQNFDLNKNYLSKNVLVYFQKDLYVPKLNSSLILNKGTPNQEIIYNKSIKDDYKNFIFFNLLKCVNLESYKSKGFDINYDHFIGKINYINYKKDFILVNNLNGKINDIVKVNLEDKILFGKIIQELNINNLTKVQFPVGTFSDLNSELNFYNEYAINTNTKSKLDILFENNKIDAKLYFPMEIKNINGENFEKYSSSSISINVRFKNLLLLANLLLDSKKLNKGINLNNITNLNNIIKSNPRINKLNFSSIKFIKTPINNSKEHKIFIYTIIDNDSKILGSPFIFNFAYENHAPRINLSGLGEEILEEKSILMFVSKNQEMNLDLKPKTSDKEILDNYFSFYHPYSYNGPDASFSVTSDGKVSFIGYQEKRYSFPITVDDREASRTRNFVFITGFPDNTNNKAAKSCLSYVSNGISSVFPVNSNYKNKIFNYTSGDYHNLYSYFISLNPSFDYNGLELPRPEITFSKTCLYDTNMFKAIYTIKDLSTLTIINSGVLGNDLKLSIPDSQNPLKISFKIINNNNQQMTEEFVIKLYPVGCLGPNPLTNTNKISRYGGDLSCCDMTGLKKNQNPILSSKLNNILNSNELKMDTNLYFCYRPSEENKNNYFNFQNKLIYNENRIPSMNGNFLNSNLYEGTIKATCKGNFPLAIHNIDSILPINSNNIENLGETNSIINKNDIAGYSRINQKIPIKVNKVQTANFCEFCYIDNYSSLSFTINLGSDANPKLWYLNTGFVQDNVGNIDGTSYPKIGISPLTNLNDENNLLVLTDENYYYSEDSGQDKNWNMITSSGSYSIGGDAKTISVGKYYCSLDSSSDSIRTDSSDYNSATDSESSCTDYYIKNFFQILSTPAPSSWICGSHQSGWTTPTQCGTYGSPIYSDSYCTGISFSCSSYSSPDSAPYAGDCPPVLPPSSSPQPSSTSPSSP